MFGRLQFGRQRWGSIVLPPLAANPIRITTSGSTFAPQAGIDAGAKILWTWSDGSTSATAAPTKTFGGAATRQQKLIVEPWSALKWLSVGYNRDDDGSSEWPIVEQQLVTAISGLQAATGLEALMVAHNTGITSLDVSGLTSLRTVEAFECSALSSINVTGCTGMTRICLERCDITGNLDLSTMTGLEDLRVSRNPKMMRLLRPSLPNLWHWCAHGNTGMTANYQSFGGFRKIRQCWIANAAQAGAFEIHSPALESAIIADNRYTSADFSGSFKTQVYPCEIVADNCQLTTVNVADCGKIMGFSARNNALTQASVDHVLATLVGMQDGGAIGTYLDGGTNAAPSAAGLQHAATLRGLGRTVTVNS